MPRRDGTGPMGMGAMTGRGIGICNSNETRLENLNAPRFGYGLGRKRGNRWLLSEQLTKIQDRLSQIEKNG